MEKRLFLSNIYDFYGVLLTERQKNVFEMYYINDFTLSEIAEANQISRQAVKDILSRTEKKLTEYEEKLKLFAKYKASLAKISEIKKLVAESNAHGNAIFGKADAVISAIEDIL